MKNKPLVVLYLIIFSAFIASAQPSLMVSAANAETFSNIANQKKMPNVVTLTNLDSQLHTKWLQALTNINAASNYQFVTNWGKSNCRCQLSIGLDTNVISAGSSIILHFWIKNSSSNNVMLAQYPWSLYLTNNSGKAYPAKLPNAIDAPFLSRNDANPGEFIVKKTRIIFSHDINPGSYILGPLTRKIIKADGKNCTLTSNSLKVKVASVSSQ